MYVYIGYYVVISYVIFASRFEHFASLLDILDYAFCFAAESAWHYVRTRLPARCFGKIGFVD